MGETFSTPLKSLKMLAGGLHLLSLQLSRNIAADRRTAAWHSPHSLRIAQ